MKASCLKGILAVLALCLVATSAHAQAPCKTPDGFSLRLSQTTQQPAPPTEKPKDAGGKGIGGTGIVASNDGKGIGGTGIRFDGDIMVRGRITGFGSVCVNGMKVEYGRSTPVVSAGRSVTPEHLKIGQVVTMTAYQSGSDIVARNISVDHIVAGKIDDINPARGTAAIDGEQVRFANLSEISRNITTGDHVQISGFRDAQDRVVASFVQKTDAGAGNSPAPVIPNNVEHVLLQGYVSDIGKDGKIEISGAATVLLAGAVIADGKISDIGINDRVVILGSRDDDDNIRVDILSIEKTEIEAEIADSETDVDSESGGKGSGKDDDREDDKDGKDDDKSGRDDSEDGRTRDDDDHEMEDDDRSGQQGDDDIHEMDAPDVDDNGIDGPDTDGPEIDAPDVDTPDVDSPDVDTPEIDSPDIDTPDIDTPDIDTPDIDAPDVDVPEIDEPDLPDTD